MRNEVVRIEKQEVVIKEYKGQRVVSLKDIDAVHERADGTARKRFNDNKKHMIEGEDFYMVCEPSEIRTFGFERPQGGVPERVVLLTESGYLMLVKSFTDDLAWKVQRQLVKSYFAIQNVREERENKKEKLPSVNMMVKSIFEKVLTFASAYV